MLIIIRQINSFVDSMIFLGFNTLQEQLFTTDTQLTPISSLCSWNDGTSITFHYFTCAVPFFPILHQFTLLIEVRMFRKFWYDELNKFKNSQLNFRDIKKQVWKPAFSTSCQLLKRLRDRSIKLVEVDKLLNEDNLAIELLNLERGIWFSERTETNPTSTWIVPCVQRMEEYRSLCQHAIAARAFLKLKQTLQLTGNFTRVEELAAKVL